ncbi:MAG: MBL fold metallo-hydrolase [Micrococcales bacterium]|nr:MBL fold metallo-hydrolase [Micrococcales bacterium]
MKITKLEHACLLLEKGGERLVVDPGSFTAPVPELENVVGVVITHEHPDHWTPDQLTRLLEANPGIPVYAPQGVADAAAEVKAEVTVVRAGDTVRAGGFELRFFGGQHALIHSSIPVVDNLGVLVDGELFYPGDSYTVPEGVEVQALAVPSSAPWLKIGDAMDYVLQVAPRHSFPTHEMVNSEAGKQMANGRIAWATEQNGGEFHALTPGDALEL